MEKSDKPTTWEQLEAEFIKRWPGPERAVKDSADYATELTSYRLSEENLLKKVEKGGVQMWSHVKAAKDLQMLAQKAGVYEGRLLIVDVRRNLAEVVRELIGTKYSKWEEFTRGREK
ncbi:hypothetical protein K435DRAFT_874348 [Dendrothele bispora CBS 962.96]|uniref:Uncharacterized protein n=1 Tax=Dendrothele bispora (strain CBS 962.96) TaxID=1314807 RepID=A0A4S8KY10_DENBC|nr:hypothetical protein K435DRAFT_874348 [Dendrothele bispora CBS 962.96]